MLPSAILLNINLQSHWADVEDGSEHVDVVEQENVVERGDESRRRAVPHVLAPAVERCQHLVRDRRRETALRQHFWLVMSLTHLRAPRIAIIGAGISGLTAAFFLARRLPSARKQ